MITKEQAQNAPYSTMEKLAMAMYDDYCAEVGGKAYDGRPLPTAKEFFNDDTKAKAGTRLDGGGEQGIRNYFILRQ